MKKTIMKIMAILLTVAMICGMFPAFASAAKVEEERPVEISKKSEEIINADVWSVIDDYEDKNIVAKRGKVITSRDYAELSYEIESLVKASETYVEGSINRNGDFFTWETTEGIVCGYSPELRYKIRNNSATGSDVIETVSYAKKAGPSSKDVYLIAPYYGYDSSFTDQYKNEANSIAKATGGEYKLYQGTNATITNIGTAMQNGGVVIFDSHGITDYSNGEDYVSRANSSYLCLKTSTGITSTDMKAVSGTYGTYYHAFNGGSSTYCVNGTAISNHMTKAAPGTILWMAICLGMATNGLCTPMRNAGVEVVYGYSQSVSFTGDYKYETYFWNKMKAGSDVKTAASYMKSAAGSNWDPAYSSYSQSQAKSNYVAFPIVVSDQDTYPGQGKVDAVQTVKSTYTLFGSSSSSGGSTGGSTGSDSGSTSTSGDTYELVTAAADLTAGKYIILANADGSYAGNYNYYALTTAKDGSYAAMAAQGLSFDSLPTSLTCDASAAGDYVWTMSGSRTSMKLATGSNYLAGASGSTKLTLATSATTWSGSYSSSYQGFTVKGNSRYISLRDDISTVGDNGAPLFCTVSSTSSGTTYLHFYKLAGSSSGSSSGSTSCSHSSTTTSTVDATCTASGKTTKTCKTCGAVVSTTTIPALGHSYKYTSNGNGTHKITCARCSYSSSANCSYSSNKCTYCGYTNASSGSGSTTTSGITSGQYVIAAKVGSSYYAMSNTFASKISATKLTISNGEVTNDVSGMVVNITKNGSYYTIDNGAKYLKYSSSTNFTTSSTAYNWNITAGVHGTYRITASSSSSRGIIFSTSTAKFGAYAVSNATATSSIYYDVELIPVSGSSDSGSSDSGSSGSGSSSGSTSSGAYTYELVTSASGLTAGDYIILTAAAGSYAGNYNYYALTTNKDGSYAAMSAQGLSFNSLPTSLTCDPSSASGFEWTMSGSRTSMKLATGSSYLAGASGSTKLTLATSATTWSATYNSSKQGFRVKGNSRYISLRDDISTVGDNGSPLFCTVSSASSGQTYLYFYKCTSSKAENEAVQNTDDLTITTKEYKNTKTGVDAIFAVTEEVAAKYDRVYAVVRIGGKEAVIESEAGVFTYALNAREKAGALVITLYAEKDGITYVGVTDTWTMANATSTR